MKLISDDIYLKYIYTYSNNINTERIINKKYTFGICIAILIVYTC